MSFFSDIQTTTDVVQDEDKLGGGYIPLESGVYDAIISYAYTGESQYGAKSITVGFKVDNHEFDETLYITNRNKETFYTSKDGKKHLLPSYITFEALSLLAAGKKITDLNTADKIIDLYDYDVGKKVPTKVNMLIDLVGKNVKLGIQKVLEFKKEKQGNEYVETDDVRTYNIIGKVFRTKDGKTVNELRAKKDEAEFIHQWSEKWTGVDYDKTKGKKQKTKATTETPSVADDIF